MSRPRFLIDENLARHSIVNGVKRHDAAIDVLHVGDTGAPGINTLDPEILDFCERTQRILVTNNRKSMPGHIADALAQGKHHWGLLKIRKGHEQDIGGIIESVVLVWEVEEAEDYIDRIEWIPF